MPEIMNDVVASAAVLPPVDGLDRVERGEACSLASGLPVVPTAAELAVARQLVALVRPRGTLVTVVASPEKRPVDGRAIDFIAEADRGQLTEIVQRVRDGRLRTHIGEITDLDIAVAVLNPSERRNGKTVIRTRSQGGRTTVGN